MDIQLLIVGVIILGACFYVGRIVFRKVKATISNSSCGSDCGCDTGSAKKIAPIQIKRTR